MKRQYMFMACAVLAFVALGLKPAFCQAKKEAEKKEALSMEAQRKHIIELANKGDATQAIKLFEEYIKTDTMNIEVFVTMAGCYAYNKDLNQAEATVKKALSVDPKNVWAVKTLAMIYRMQGEKVRSAAEKAKLFSLAQTEIEKALTAEPENPFNDTEAAIIYFRQGQKAEAAKLIKKAAAAQPNDRYIADAKKMIEAAR